MDGQEKMNKRIAYIKAIVFWIIAFFACLFIENTFALTEKKDIIESICNAFTVPGVIFAGIAGLSYIAYLGGYDGIGYAFSNFGLHNIFVTRQPTRYKDFYEYKQAKDARGRKWLPHYLVIGLASLAIGGILLIVYFTI